MKAVLSAAAVVLGACNRYEWVPDYMAPECQGFHRPLSTGALKRETSLPDSVASLRGWVVIDGTNEGLSGAVLTLATVPPVAVTSDSLGFFRFERTPRGTFALRTRRVGTRGRVDTVALPLQPDLVVLLPLERDVLDGPCSGFGSVRVPKPWWKLW